MSRFLTAVFGLLLFLCWSFVSAIAEEAVPGPAPPPEFDETVPDDSLKTYWGGTAFMSVNNVFDQSVVSQVGLPEAGRSFFAGFRLER